MHYQWNKYWGRISTKITFGKISWCVMDSDLTFKTHVKKKCATAMLNLQRIKNIRKDVSKESCAKLVVRLCMLHLDYSNSILSGLPDCTINQMQCIQNYVAKLVLGKTKYDSSTASLAELHWLPVRSWIRFKTLTLVFKYIKGDAPNYLKNLLITCPVTSQTLRSSNFKDHLVIPQTVRTTFAARSFSVVGTMLWNKLPNYIEDSNNVDEFKRNSRHSYL